MSYAGGYEDPGGTGENDMDVGDTYEAFQKAWGIVAPTVMLIYIIPVFLINIVLWLILFSLALPRQLLRVRFVPLFLIALGVGLLLIQANQDAIVEVLNVATACVDQIYAFFGKAIFDDVIITLYPVCTLFSFLISVVKYTVRGLTNEYRCYFSCDPTFCECTTCDGGSPCGCDTCGDVTCSGSCDTGAIGCPTAGGFAIFLGDCCICFITAFRQILLIAGIPLPDAVQLVQDLIDFLDIAPSTNPVLFDDFVANFPQPGDVDWIYSDTLKRDIERDAMWRHIPAIGKNRIDAHQANMVRYYSWRKFVGWQDKRIEPVLLERYVNMSSGGYTHEEITREIPDTILEILCAGKTPGVDCPEPDPTTGYNYPIFELVANEFFGPFIELFSDIVLWLFNFLAVFFDLGYNQFLQLLDSILNGPGPSAQDLTELVVQAFQLFTQEFLCQLVGWSIEIPGLNEVEECCGMLDFRNPVAWLESLLTVADCVFGWDPVVLFGCFGSLSDFVSCAGGAVPTAVASALSAATSSAEAAADAAADAAGSVVGGRNAMLKHNAGSDTYMGGGGHGRAPRAVNTSKPQDTSPYVPFWKFWSESKTSEGIMMGGGGGGHGHAPQSSVFARPSSNSKLSKMIETSRKRNEIPRKTPEEKQKHKKERAILIYRNPVLRSIHERLMGMKMEDAYPHLVSDFEKEDRIDLNPVMKPTAGAWDEKMNEMFGRRKQTIMHKIVEHLDVLKSFKRFSVGALSTMIDASGEILFETVDAYVSQVGVGKPALFNRKSFDISTIRRLRQRALAMRGKRSDFDHQMHLDLLDQQERLYWQEQSMEYEARVSKHDPMVGMTHGEKALRHTAQFASTIKKMLGYAVWDDASYDFIVPSTEDLMTEIDQRALGSSVVRAFSHWFKFIKQDNEEREAREGRTIDDRPAFVIQIETVLKTMVYRFVIPAGLPDLKKDLCERGPRWCQTAHRVIDPSIRGYEIDMKEKQERIELRKQGDTSVPFQLTDITFGTVLAWMLEHASYRANAVAHRRELSRAVFEGNQTRYIQLKMSQMQLKHPLNRLRNDDSGQKTIMKSRFSREYDRMKAREQYSDNGRASWFSWWSGEDKQKRMEQGHGVDPEIIMFFRDHNRRITSATTNVDILTEYKRTISRLPQLAVIGSVLLPLLKNIRYVFGVAVPILSSPYAQNVYSFYIDFLTDFLGDIINEPIADLVNSPGFLLDFAQEFAITTLDSINYLATEFERILLCLAPQIVIQTILYYLSAFAILVPYVGTVLSSLIGFFNTIGTFFLPLIAVCPAEVIPGEQNVFNYFFDVLDCDPSIVCGSSDDCPGQGPCRCPIPRVTQWLSLFWKIDPDTTCTFPDLGNCLCFWQGPCDQAAPELTINDAFDDTCDKFGYATGADLVPWYPGNPDIFGSVGNFLDYVGNYLKSGFVWIQFISKTIARGWEPFFSRTTFIAIAGIFVGLAIAGIAVGLTVQRVFFILFTIVLVIGVAYGGPVYTDFVADNLIPAIQNVGSTFGFLSSFTDFLLDFFQFDNATDSDPIGSPDPSEFTCFLLNSGTGMLALGITSILLLLLLTLISLGILADLFLVIWYFLLIVPRTVWRLYEFVIYVYQDEDSEGGYGGGGYGGGDYYYYPGRGRVRRRQLAYDEEPLLSEVEANRDKDFIYDEMMTSQDGSIKNIGLRNIMKTIPRNTREIMEKMEGRHGSDWRDWRIGAPVYAFDSVKNIIPSAMRNGVGLDDAIALARNTAARRGWRDAEKRLHFVQRVMGIERRPETTRKQRKKQVKKHIS